MITSQNQLKWMVNWLFGGWCFGIRIWVLLRIPIPCIKGSQEPKPPIYHQLTTISATRLKWILPAGVAGSRAFSTPVGFLDTPGAPYRMVATNSGKKPWWNTRMDEFCAKCGWWPGCIGRSCLLGKIMLFLQLITPISGLICWYSWPI